MAAHSACRWLSRMRSRVVDSGVVGQLGLLGGLDLVRDLNQRLATVRAPATCALRVTHMTAATAHGMGAMQAYLPARPHGKRQGPL